mmetsp:Transcript_117910/g.241024  ORF Transcript_117910/g.241024 Transcript_117910/m.241024 type:complete len:245 (+) Transcript_117910:694-1428(+)
MGTGAADGGSFASKVSSVSDRGSRSSRPARRLLLDRDGISSQIAFFSLLFAFVLLLSVLCSSSQRSPSLLPEKDWPLTSVSVASRRWRLLLGLFLGLRRRSGESEECFPPSSFCFSGRAASPPAAGSVFLLVFLVSLLLELPPAAAEDDDDDDSGPPARSEESCWVIALARILEPTTGIFTSSLSFLRRSAVFEFDDLLLVLECNKTTCSEESPARAVFSTRFLACFRSSFTLALVCFFWCLLS